MLPTRWLDSHGPNRLPCGVGPLGIERRGSGVQRPQNAQEHVTTPTVQVTLDPEGIAPGHAMEQPELERYRIEREVGSGGMAVVYAARDLELDREVALKVVRLDVGYAQDQQRLLEEARALAGLNHPNIVPVYDVGHASDGRLYMAMELVRGKSLGEWLECDTRAPREILDVLVAAGRGLAAAHAVDLVHCDFKPSNVLVGRDGRVRVVDFGIARRVSMSATITQHGHDATPAQPRLVLGTPRYMSPEQARGEDLDAATDQFSYCLTLYESLYGQLPFLGASHRQRMRNARAGNVRKAPRGTVVPGRVFGVLARGLSPTPSGRWPNMHALLRALGRACAPSRLWLPAAAVGILGVSAASAYALPDDDPCASTRDDVDELWSAERRVRLREAFATSGLPDAASEHARVEARLTSFAEQWASARARVCVADTPNEQRGPRRRCLQRGLEQFGVLVEVLGTADAATLRNADQALHTLSSVAACETRGGADATDAPASIRDRVDELDEELATVPMLVALHRYTRAEALTSRVLHEAERLGHIPLLAEAQYRRADVLSSAGRQVAAATLFERAFHTAETARRDRLAAKIAVDLQLVYGYRLARPRLAERWTKQARAAVERLGDDAGYLEAEFIRTQGLIALRNSDLDLARERFEASVATYDALDEPNPDRKAEALSNLGIACLDLGLLDDAGRALERALGLIEDRLGPYDTQLITVMNNLGSLAQTRGDLDAALGYFRRVYEAELALYGPVDVRIAMSLNNVGSALSALHRDDEAVRYYERSIRAYESGDHHGVDLARPVGNLAVTHMRAGELELAQIHLRRAIQLIEDESGPMHASLGVHWFNLASVRLEKGELELALAALERCIEVDEHVVGRRHPNVAQTLTAMASIHARSGEADLAMKLLEEALQIFADFEVDPLLVGVTRLRLGKLLWSEDRDRARALIDQADEAFTAAADAAGPELDQLREWQDEVGY